MNNWFAKLLDGILYGVTVVISILLIPLILIISVFSSNDNKSKESSMTLDEIKKLLFSWSEQNSAYLESTFEEHDGEFSFKVTPKNTKAAKLLIEFSKDFGGLWISIMSGTIGLSQHHDYDYLTATPKRLTSILSAYESGAYHLTNWSANGSFIDNQLTVVTNARTHRSIITGNKTFQRIMAKKNIVKFGPIYDGVHL